MLKNKKIRKIIFLTSLLLLVFFIYFGVGWLSRSKNEVPAVSEGNNNGQQNECANRNLLDGVCQDKSANVWPVAVMIDNHPDAWPQFGLSRAALVYSTLVEGGATRLMAVFTGADALKIGPVRSARPYYLSWAKEIDALYAHSGGSPAAIDKIKADNVHNLEEATSYGPLYFYRDKTKDAPHNLYTSSERLDVARLDFGFASSTPVFEVWQFSEDANFTTSTALGLNVDYSAGDLFDVSYKYQTSTDAYLRFQNKAPQLDGLNNKQIEVKTVIVEFVPEEIHLDVADRLSMDVVGSGQALILYHGKKLVGRWEKKADSARTKFYVNESEVVFPPGNIWIEVVPGERTVTVE